MNVLNDMVEVIQTKAQRIDLNTDMTVTVDDTIVTVYSRQRMRHRTVSIKIGPSIFTIAVKSEKKSMKFLLEEWNHPGDDFDGLLGFVMSNSYKVNFADLTFSLTHISDYQLKYAFN